MVINAWSNQLIGSGFGKGYSELTSESKSLIHVFGVHCSPRADVFGMMRKARDVESNWAS